MSKERLWQRLMELGEIGLQSDSGGVTRLSFSQEERLAKDAVISYMTEAGLTVREDGAGNVIGRKEGHDPLSPVVLTGSHIDTVPHGGKFDGALGVIGAIEALQRMNEQGIETAHPIEVVVFTDEEGARFGFGMIGSRAVAGTLRPEDLQHTDDQQLSIAQAMGQAGLSPEEISTAARTPAEIRAYIELHIEQATVLEQRQAPVGIVSGIAGPLWMQFTLVGEAGHAGATPMKGRKDPLVAATRIMTYIDHKVKQYPNAVATVGKFQVYPGGINIIPGEVTFTVDLRDIDEAVRDQIEQEISSYAQQICDEQGVALHVEVLQRVAPVPCAPQMQQIIEQSCGKMGLEAIVLPSGAGHDGMQFSELCPIGMIFVRSKKGISHSPEEWSSPEDCEAGTQVLYHTLLQLAVPINL